MIQAIIAYFTSKTIPVKWIALGSGLAGVAFTLYLGFVFVTNMQSQLIELETTNKVLKNTLETQKNTIEQILEDNENINNLNTTLQENVRRVEKENSRLNKLFREHDLTNLAKEKPGLIEKRINDATKEVFNDFESTTTN